MTERLIWTIGAAGTLRSFTRSGCDWVATTYRCLLLEPETFQLRYTRGGKMNLPIILVKHSSPGIASRWLHLLRSKFFAKSTAGCCSLPCRYNSCMQHCVITKERLCHLSNQRFFPSLIEEVRDPLGLTSP